MKKFLLDNCLVIVFIIFGIYWYASHDFEKELDEHIQNCQICKSIDK